MLDFILVKDPFFRFYAGPFNAEAISIEIRFRHHFNILFIAIIMIHRSKTRFAEILIFHVLHCPIVAMNVVPLNLMGRSCRS